MIGKMDLQLVVQQSVCVCGFEPAQDWETLIFFVDSRGLPPTYQQASRLSERHTSESSHVLGQC